ncbi:MAG: hypothetical protein R3A79_13690 [Nannocystaceae bacterium]
MSDSKNLGLRDSRDRIIDLLGIGETYPLCDVAVTEELKVPFNANARLVVAPSQEAVRYELRDDMGDGPSGRRDQPLERIVDGAPIPVAVDGSGGAVELLTPAVEEDVTFTIFAAKRHLHADGGDSLRAVILHQRVRIKVGLDVALPARVVVAGDTELLEHQAGADFDARIVYYGGAAVVAIDGAQEGVDYELVSVDGDVETPRCEGEVRGLGEGTTITITSTALTEDVDLRVRATKQFTVAENRDTEVVLLDAVLPVRVRANPALAAAADPVVAYGAASQVRIAATQASATYQLFTRPIRDRDFARLGDVERFTVPVAGEAAVPIARPAWARVWATPAEMEALGEPVAGNGGELVLPLGELTGDVMAIVRAVKQHSAAGDAPATITSAVQLAAATATLVEPDPAPALELRVTMRGGATTGEVEVIGGQPGVLYALRRTADGEDLGPPAYVHQVDDRDARENKGVGQLAVGVDLVVTAGAGGIVREHASNRRPPNPVIPTPAIEAGARLHVHAVKAQTRVAVGLAATAEITAVPTIANERVGVDSGATARIEVRPSATGDRYQLWRGDQAVGAALDGDGEDLALVSDPVAVDSDFVVVVSPTEDRGIPVHRAVDVSVPLRPRTDLRARIVAAEAVGAGDGAARRVSFGEPVRVEIRGTQADVDYRLVALGEGEDEAAMSETARGDGGTIIVVSQDLAEDATLRVRAIRRFYGVDDELAEPRQLLAAAMPVAVRANAALAAAVDPASVVDFAATPTLALQDTQRSATYAAFVRPVADDERVFAGDVVGDAAILEVAVAQDRPSVRVIRPPKTELWADLAGFVAAGDAIAGTGGELALALGALETDTLVLVRAAKAHADAPASAVQLAAAQLVLVRPNAAPGLTLVISGVGSESGASVEFVGGEPGVFYQLVDGEGATVGPPAYVHGTTAGSGSLGRGVGELRLEVDMAVARGDDGPVLAPRVDGLALAPGASLSVTARRALSGVEAELVGAATIDALPTMTAAAASVAAGEGTTIVVAASVVGQRYQLLKEGAALTEVLDGDGSDISVETGAIDVASTFVVEVRRAEVEGLVVAQRVAIAIEVDAG